MATAIMWLITTDKQTWSRSGSTSYLKEIGTVTVTNGNLWFLTESKVLEPKMLKALEYLDINHVMLSGDHIQIMYK